MNEGDCKGLEEEIRKRSIEYWGRRGGVEEEKSMGRKRREGKYNI